MPAVAAEIAVPFPFSTPEMLVVKVIAGVEVAVATVPAKPLAETTEAEVTVPLPAGVAQVLSPLKNVVLLGVPDAVESRDKSNLFL